MEKELIKQHRQQMGEQLRQAREAQGWSVEQVALMCDVKDATIEKIETGLFNVGMDLLARICDVLGCEISVTSNE